MCYRSIIYITNTDVVTNSWCYYNQITIMSVYYLGEIKWKVRKLVFEAGRMVIYVT